MAKKREQRHKAPAPAVATAAARESMDVWDRIAWTCLHLLVLLVPIAISNLGPFSPGGLPLTFDQFDIAKVFVQRALVLIALGAWAVGILLRGGGVRVTRGEWVLLAFLGWVVLTSVFSVHPPTAVFGKYRRFEGLISFFTYAGAFFVALQLADRSSRVRSLARSLAIGGFLVAWYGAIQVVGSVPVGVARVLQPVSVVAAVVLPLALAYGGMRGNADPETRRAFLLGAAIALVGGIVFSAGLADNLERVTYTGAQVVALDPVRWGNLPFESNRAFSTFGNPDLLGGYLIFPWAVALSLALTEKHPVWRSLYWLATLLNVFVGLTSYVRGAWIGATVSLLALVVAYLRARSGTQMRLTATDKTYIAGTAVAGVAVAVASSLRPDAVRNVLTRVQSIFQFDQGSALTRFQIWEAARSAIAEQPILGWGADTFRLLFPMFKPAEYVAVAGYLSVADNVHNYPLQLASGIGVPGALLFYGIIVVALAVAARTAFARGAAGDNLVLAGFWAAVIGYVVHLMFGLSVTGSTIMMWLAMGVLMGPSAVRREVPARSWRIAAGVVAALVLAGTVLNIRYVVADNRFLQAKVTGPGSERVEHVEAAIRLNPFNDMYRIELGTAWGELFSASAAAYDSARSTGTDTTEMHDRAEALYAQAADAYEAAIAYVPLEYDTYVFLTNLHNEAATYLDPAYAEEAVRAGKRAVAVEEHGPAARVQLAHALIIQGRVDEAVAELEVAARLDPNYLQAHIMLGDAYRRAGRYDEAMELLETLTGRYPADADVQALRAAVEASRTPVTDE